MTPPKESREGTRPATRAPAVQPRAKRLSRAAVPFQVLWPPGSAPAPARRQMLGYAQPAGSLPGVPCQWAGHSGWEAANARLPPAQPFHHRAVV